MIMKRPFMIMAFGEEKSLAEWSRDPRTAVSYSTLHLRITRFGWDPEKAITQPSQQATP